jgi:hypothetical protein
MNLPGEFIGADAHGQRQVTAQRGDTTTSEDRSGHGDSRKTLSVDNYLIAQERPNGAKQGAYFGSEASSSGASGEERELQDQARAFLRASAENSAGKRNQVAFVDEHPPHTAYDAIQQSALHGQTRVYGQQPTGAQMQQMTPRMAQTWSQQHHSASTLGVMPNSVSFKAQARAKTLKPGLKSRSAKSSAGNTAKLPSRSRSSGQKSVSASLRRRLTAFKRSRTVAAARTSAAKGRRSSTVSRSVKSRGASGKSSGKGRKLRRSAKKSTSKKKLSRSHSRRAKSFTRHTDPRGELMTLSSAYQQASPLLSTQGVRTLQEGQPLSWAPFYGGPASDVEPSQAGPYSVVDLTPMSTQMSQQHLLHEGQQAPEPLIHPEDADEHLQEPPIYHQNPREVLFHEQMRMLAEKRERRAQLNHELREAAQDEIKQIDDRYRHSNRLQELRDELRYGITAIKRTEARLRGARAEEGERSD